MDVSELVGAAVRQVGLVASTAQPLPIRRLFPLDGLDPMEEEMKKLVAAALMAGALFVVGDGPAFSEPPDRGNCVSNRDNGGAAGERTSSAAGPGFGSAVADGIGGGVIGSTASDPDCRRR